MAKVDISAVTPPGWYVQHKDGSGTVLFSSGPVTKERAEEKADAMNKEWGRKAFTVREVK